MLILQTSFVFYTDIWAETHAEYLEEAIKQPFTEAFSYGWAGYLTVIPSVLSQLYAALPAPFGYADVFFQLVIIPSAILMSAFTASKYNRTLIANDYLRILLGFGLLLLLYEKSTFTIINIWYMGFIPIVLISLNPIRLSAAKQILYALFGIIVALTKPSLLLLPFVIYRAIKTKEWISNGLIAIAITLQTWVMIAIDPRQSANDASRDVFLIIKSTFIGSGTELLKLLGIEPKSLLWVIVASLLLCVVAFLAWQRLGIIRFSLLLFALTYSVYAYVLAPDARLYINSKSFDYIYHFNFKIQREYLIYAFIMLATVFATQAGWNLLRPQLKEIRLQQRVQLTGFIAVSLFLALIYRPIDIESAGVSAHITDFRHNISNGQSICLPLPPTPAYFKNNDYLWRYAYNTECYAYNAHLKPDYSNFNFKFTQGMSFEVLNIPRQPIKTFYVIIKNNQPRQAGVIKLTEKLSGNDYYASVPARNTETFTFIPINLAGMPNRDYYNFTLTASSDNLRLGKFIEADDYAYYPIFGPTLPAIAR